MNEELDIAALESIAIANNYNNYLKEIFFLNLDKNDNILDFGAGLMKNAPNYFYGPYPETVGHSGWGGSCVFADHINGISGAYVMNKQNNTLIGDLRPKRIIDEMYNCL